MKVLNTVVSLFILTTVANAQELNVELKVLSHQAVYETIIEKIPFEHCWEEKTPVRKAQSNNSAGGVIGGLLGSQVGKGRGKDAAMIAGTLIGSGPKSNDEFFGGVLGGIAGKQIGKGKGKDAAIVLGTIIGSSLASKPHEPGVYRKEERCETRYREVEKKVLSGYLHTVEFLGQKYERFYTHRKDTVHLSLNLSFEADKIHNRTVVKPVKQANHYKRGSKVHRNHYAHRHSY